MNGGAWLSFGGEKFDVLLRDLDVVERWSARAGEGQYEVDALLGYLAGCPTYSLRAELSTCRLLRGALDRSPEFPDALAAAAPPRWRFHAAFSLEHARMRAERGDLAGAVGQAARRRWRAPTRGCARRGPGCSTRSGSSAGRARGCPAAFGAAPRGARELVRWVESVRSRLEMR